MRTYVKHLWDQLVNDENAAKIRIAAAKTWFWGMVIQVGVSSAGDASRVLSWGKKEWIAAAGAALFAAGAKASLPAVPKADSPPGATTPQP